MFDEERRDLLENLRQENLNFLLVNTTAKEAFKVGVINDEKDPWPPEGTWLSPKPPSLRPPLIPLGEDDQ